MAVRPCKECGKPVSSKAKSCPHCGAEQPKPTSRVSILIAGLTLFAILYGVANQNSEEGTQAATKPKEKTPAELQSEREFQQVVASVRALKGSMKNPKSFELVEALMMQGPTLCITYRSTNSFNAVVTDYYVVSEKVSSSEPSAWNKHCAGKTGTSYAYVKNAI